MAAYTAKARLRSLPAGNVVAISASAAGEADGGTEALERASAEQHDLVLGGTAGEGGDREQEDADDEDPAAAVEVGQPAAEQQDPPKVRA